MTIQTLVVGAFQSCCYIVSCEVTSHALIIDPGADADTIIERIRDSELVPSKIVNTHGHADHIGANAALRDAFPEIQICIHSSDAPLLTSSIRNLSMLVGRRIKSPIADILLDEGDVVEVGQLKFEVIHVPGHTSGGICLLHNSQEDGEPATIFCGDTLFADGIGRSDFPGGDHRLLIDGIEKKILSLPGDTKVYPGHGPSTTIEQELLTNPFIQ